MGDIYPEGEEHSQGQGKKKPKFVTPPTVLESYGTNISKLAEADELDPVVGRVEEITQIVQILGRRRKNNPILVGNPGVGKCVSPNTKIKVRNTATGAISEVTIEEFNKMI